MTTLKWAQERLANTERIMWLKQTAEDRASWAEDRDYWQKIVDALATADTARAQAFEEGRQAERLSLIAEFDQRGQRETTTIQPGLWFATGLIELRARAASPGIEEKRG